MIKYFLLLPKDSSVHLLREIGDIITVQCAEIKTGYADLLSLSSVKEKLPQTATEAANIKR